MQTMQRCKLCHLPQSYPGITYDQEGVCSLCRAKPAQEKPWLGLDALKQKVARTLADEKYKDRPYDCAVAFSGGRDSTYLLYLAKEVLGLKVLAVSLRHRFMPEETQQTIANICKGLGVELQMIENEALNEYGLGCVQAWAKKPTAAALVSFCTGCRFGIKWIIPQLCKEKGIPLLLVGNTRMEQMNYCQQLLSPNQQKPSQLGNMAGYVHQVLRNPRLLVSPKCTCVQTYEFAYPIVRRIHRSKAVTVLAPMRDYVDVSGDEVTARLAQLGWQHNDRFRSQWRADCYVNIVRQYFYQKMLGFNDQDVHWAEQLRLGLTDQETARQRLQEENTIEEAVVEQILREHYGVELQDVLQRMNKQ